jgi:undecaprenyl-diphosphatase
VNLLTSIILGLVQGLTEFLPISSSAHLTFAEHILNLPTETRLALDILLHLGTALALVVFFGRRLARLLRDLLRPGGMPGATDSRRLLLAIAIGTIPAGIAGLILSRSIEALFADPRFSSGFLLVTSLVLFLTRWTRGERDSITWRDGLLVGTAQAIAILPGISRSGATIAAALFIGLARPRAFEFSFLLSIPAVLGAAAVALSSGPLPAVPFLVLAAGFLAAFGSGLLALYLVRRLLLARRFYLFAAYCLVLGVLALILLRPH